MTRFRPALVVAALALAVGAAQAQTKSAAAAASAPSKKAPAKGAVASKSRKPATKPEPKPVEIAVPDATQQQIAAAEKVFYGKYACEFDQTIDIAANPKHFGYVDLKLAKSDWLMKPVVSTTGAIRLEDVQGETLMVQIMNKSMLLNVKTGHRLVDDCISPKQREFIEAQRALKATDAASAAAAAGAPLILATAPAPAPAASAASTAK
ncbi:MAG: hypothetical protein JSR59_08425 [Proteobacteria bacterium]|nr:hypothetical protein [Pseudomonadota bacterium]